MRTLLLQGCLCLVLLNIQGQCLSLAKVKSWLGLFIIIVISTVIDIIVVIVVTIVTLLGVIVIAVIVMHILL